MVAVVDAEGAFSSRANRGPQSMLRGARTCELAKQLPKLSCVDLVVMRDVGAPGTSFSMPRIE